MIESPVESPRVLTLQSLRVGALLAEGGEGRVFELPLQPHLVFKEYRSAPDRAHLEELLRWPGAGDPELVSRVRAGAAWPVALVERGGNDRRRSSDPVGVLVPRAPRRFSLRHRDGTTRLASLSYLTADPRYREVAYGLSLPAPFSPERFGLVYSLARVLDAFDRLDPAVGHGDLSAKNVLWSLQRGPEVFLIDCDNCERYGPDGVPLSADGRRRAMTPNWNDPAVGGGANPHLTSDRYSLALVFLRVVGAANFPVQARQREGGAIGIEFPVPSDYAGEVLVGSGSPLWDLCSRGLSTERLAARPRPCEWVAALEAILLALGAAQMVHSVWAQQGGVAPLVPAAPAAIPPDPAERPGGPAPLGPAAVPDSSEELRDVTVRPVVARSRVPPPKRVVAGGLLRTDPQRPWRPGPTAGQQRGPLPPPQPVGSARGQTRATIGDALRWWVHTHQALLEALRLKGAAGSPGTVGLGEAVQRIALCAAVDVVVALLGLFIVAMAVAPVLGL